MSKQYSISNNFDLTEEISFEPIGCYYKAISIDGESQLVLLLNNMCSKLARSNWDNLYTSYTPGSNNDSSINPLLPVLDIIDFIEGVALVMPYFEGETLAEYINNNQPVDIPTAKTMLTPLLQELSELHAKESFHGFINFSTAWVTSDNTIVIVGYEIFDKIFNNLIFEDTSVDNSRIHSCFNSDVSADKIKCSIYSDYYSVLVIVCSLIQGYISSNKLIDSNLLAKKLSKDTRVYLTKTFCNKSYNEFTSVNNWIGALQEAKLLKIAMRGCALAGLSLTVIILSKLIFTQFSLEEGAALVDNHLQDVNLTNSEQQSDIEKFEQLTKVDDYQIVDEESELVTQDPLDDSSSNERLDKSSEFDADNSVDNDSGETLMGQPQGAESNKTNATIREIKEDKEQEKSIRELLDETRDEVEYETVNKNPKRKNNSSSKQVITSMNSLQCKNGICHDLISAGMFGPRLNKTLVDEQINYVMDKPITRNDYYLYCFTNKNCQTYSKFKDLDIANCIYEKGCAGEISKWLSQPMAFASSNQFYDYLDWLNNMTKVRYDAVPDLIWSTLATKLSPKKYCQSTMDDSFSVYNKHPELVKMNQVIALRGPVQFVANKQQCKMALKIHKTDKYIGKVFVRLIRYSPDYYEAQTLDDNFKIANQ